MPKAGPVSQARDLYLQLLTCQQAIPIQRGASIYAANLLDLYEISPLDALSLGVNGFSYEGEWGQPDQTSWTTSGADLLPLAEEAGVSLEIQPIQPDTDQEDAEPTTQLPPLLPFGEPAGGKEGASSVEVIFSASASTRFTYDSAPANTSWPGPTAPPRPMPTPTPRPGSTTCSSFTAPLPPGRRLHLGL